MTNRLRPSSAVVVSLQPYVAYTQYNALIYCIDSYSRSLSVYTRLIGAKSVYRELDVDPFSSLISTERIIQSPNIVATNIYYDRSVQWTRNRSQQCSATALRSYRYTCIIFVVLDPYMVIFIVYIVRHYNYKINMIFTARLHVMQRTAFHRSFCPSVCLSIYLFVCLSNAWIVTKRKKLCLHSYTKWKIIHPTLLTRRIVGLNSLPEIFGQTDRDVAKTPIFNRHSLVATQP